METEDPDERRSYEDMLIKLKAQVEELKDVEVGGY
jgi:hypothetical protein